MVQLTDEYIREKIISLITEKPITFSHMGAIIGEGISRDKWDAYVDQYERIIDELENEGIIRKTISDRYVLIKLSDLWKWFK